MHTDFLIIGQGLAGSLLAFELMQRDCRVLVLDNGQENASKVAAGLINPVTGMRLVKSAEVDRLLPVAKAVYQQLGGFFQQDFYLEKPMLRRLDNEAEVMQARKRLLDPAYQDYLQDLITPSEHSHDLNAPYGFLAQQQTGYLLTRPLLSHLKAFFIAKNAYQCGEFSAKSLQLEPELRYQDITTNRIVFCEGHHATGNPWFSWLPFQPVKGELLTLAHRSQLPDKMINYGNWVIPLNNQQIRIGATFDHVHLDDLPTEAGKNALLEALNALFTKPIPFDLINHQANIRPCTLDKQPFIGFHPQHPQLAIFNGFGAKGSLQIPLYSQLFADSLINNIPPPSDIQRYYATHFIG
jgi:glycine/D-amino acid oxidase-like deaminating enzyme